MKICFTFLTAALLFGSAFAQKGYYDGYVIKTATGDTVFGMIKHKSGDEVKEKITLKISEEEKETLDPKEITSFVAGEEEYFSIIPPDEEELVFMRRLSYGALTLYEWQYIYEQNGTQYQYDLYIQKEGETGMTFIKPGSFKKQMAEFVSAYPELTTEVEKGKYKIDNIVELVNKYNQFMIDQE